MKKYTERQNALKPDQICLLWTLPRRGLRAALGQAEVERDVHRVKKSWETATWETAHLSKSGTVPEGHSS